MVPTRIQMNPSVDGFGEYKLMLKQWAEIEIQEMLKNISLSPPKLLTNEQIAQELTKKLNIANDEIRATYLLYYCGTGYGSRETIIRGSYNSNWTAAMVQLEVDVIQDQKDKIISRIKSQCTLITIPVNPAKQPNSGNETSNQNSADSLSKKTKLEVNYDAAAALYANLQYKYQIERGNITCDAPPVFSATEFSYYGNSTSAKEEENKRYENWVRYIYLEYDNFILRLVNKCGLTGTRVQEIQVINQPANKQLDSGASQSPDSTLPRENSGLDLNSRPEAPSTKMINATLKTLSAFEIESQLSIKAVAKAKYSLNFDTKFSNSQLKVVVGKKGAITMTFFVNTNSDGNAVLNLSKKLTGFTVSLLAGSTLLDKDIIK
jgi:hypothetical protein